MSENNLYVNWGRYDAEHTELVRRVDALEGKWSGMQKRVVGLLGTVASAVLTAAVIMFLHLH
jgi:hypothetical protein